MRLQVGYVPLTDAAPVVAAAELGFAQAEGLELELSREPSWATLRDRLALGHLDAAHMLAPLALASALGLSGPRAHLAIPMTLSLNGNAITVSDALWAAMRPEDGSVTSVAQAFARVAAIRAAERRPLILGTVHPFSCHTYQLRLFAARGGLDLSRLARVVVVPPPQTVAALRAGSIDGFCVGAPWNSVAVEAGFGRIAALCCDLVPDCPEKVLAVSAPTAEWLSALVRAVRHAGAWCAQPANHGALARLLVEKAGLPDLGIARASLAGDLVVGAGTARNEPAYVRFGEGVHPPAPAHAHWIVEEMRAAGQAGPQVDAAAAAALYRPDLFANA